MITGTVGAKGETKVSKALLLELGGMISSSLVQLFESL